MFGIGFMELCVICVVALLVVGPQKLPEMMQQIGRFMVQVRRMSWEVRHSFDEAVNKAEAEMKNSAELALEAPADSSAKSEDEHLARQQDRFDELERQKSEAAYDEGMSDDDLEAFPSEKHSSVTDDVKTDEQQKSKPSKK